MMRRTNPTRPALPEDVAAKSADAGDAIRQVHVLFALERLRHLRRHDRGRHSLDVVIGEGRGAAHRHEQTADTHHRRPSGLEVDVGRTFADGRRQELVEVHG